MKIVRLSLWMFLAIGSALGCLAAIAGWVILSSPNVLQLKGCLKTSMFEVQLCPGSKDYVSLNQVSKSFLDALILTEDASFYSHQGFDWFEIKASFEDNIKSGKTLRGASTLSQQLVKNVFLSSEKNYWRKLREAYLTWRLEQNFSKKEILERYVNVVEFGPNIYGVKRASQFYFRKAPSDLNLLESSFLVFLLPNPKGYSKSFKQQKLTPFAKSRVLDISYRMAQTNRVSWPTYIAAKQSIDLFPWEGVNLVEIADASSIEKSLDAASDSLPTEVINVDDTFDSGPPAKPSAPPESPPKQEPASSDEEATFDE